MINYRPYTYFASNGVLWETLWQKEITINPIEEQLLKTSWVRRLNYIHHGGAVFTNTAFNINRLQHTLGVFALICTFEPENIPLRIAALLHDIGHLPFSHTLEQLMKDDHHQSTEEALNDIEIASILQRFQIPKQETLDYISGRKPSLLRDIKPKVHCDHLDSWVRTAQVFGSMPIVPEQFLERIKVNNGSLSMDLESATLIFEIICAEARFHCSDENIGVNGVLRSMVQRLINDEALSINQLRRFTDFDLIYFMSNHHLTASETNQWLMHPSRIKVTRDRESVPQENPYVTEVDKLYVSVPMVGDRLLTDIHPELITQLEQLEQLKGTYYIYWIEE